MNESKEGNPGNDEATNEEVAYSNIDFISTYDPADGRTIDNLRSHNDIRKIIAGDITLLEFDDNKDEYSYLKELDEFTQRSKKEEKIKDPDVFESEFLPELLNLINDGETLKALQKYCFFTDRFVELDEYPSYIDVLQKNPIFKDLITLKKMHDFSSKSFSKVELKWEKENLQSLIDTYNKTKRISKITKTTSKQTSLVLTKES